MEDNIIKLKKYIKLLSELDLEKNSDRDIIDAYYELTTWLHTKD